MVRGFELTVITLILSTTALRLLFTRFTNMTLILLLTHLPGIDGLDLLVYTTSGALGDHVILSRSLVSDRIVGLDAC